jgi:predicted alpha/beta-fold hydrolase
VVIERLRARWRGPLGAVGFSMGGNILLKWLGEAGAEAPLEAAVAVSVPFDLAACAAALDGPGLFPALYRKRFLRTLRRKALAVSDRFPGLLDPAAIRACRSFARYDDLVTAPLFGFASAADYWARCSSAGFLAHVRRPVRLISAEDDPIVPGATIPRAAIAANPQLDGRLLARGGHVGFVTGGWRRSYAIDAMALDFLAPRLSERRG